MCRSLFAINRRHAEAIPTSSSINEICPALIFHRAIETSKNAALSISGNSICRPDRGGHSMVNVLLTQRAGSHSPSKAHA